MLGLVYKIILLLILLNNIGAQPDSRFSPFDWVLYSGARKISSITEGFTFAYIGTESGGLKRFNLFGNYFDEPITTAQGLENNNITAVHFDKGTGLIWVSTPQHIQYSFSREGDWYSFDLQNLGLSRYDQIKQIGSSSNYIWLKARSSYVKLGNSSGTLIGIYPSPDELNINWSSGQYVGQGDIKEILMNYHILDGWTLNGDQLLDRLGRISTISTGFIGNHGNVFLGSDNGDIFFGTKTMETLSPVIPDIDNTDVLSLYKSVDQLWIGSYDFISSKGISKLDMRTNSSQLYSFEETINMTPSPIYSIYQSDHEVWAGGEGLILYFDQKDNYWRTLGEGRGSPSGKIWDLYGNEVHIWAASSMGLRRIERATMSEDPIGIEGYFEQRHVYDITEIDDQIWIGSIMGLYIFSHDNPQLLQANDIGRKNFPERFYKITAIEEYNRLIYVVGEMGIAKFNMEEREWDLLYTSGVYQGKTVYSLAVNDKYLFLGTDNGLIRVNKRTGLIKDYLFPFIGQINEIVLEEKIVWLGTSTGLVKFKWKRDL
tara:strand:+ start:1419 stop:3047 length:1629 start_codon:yes stop_codon:yes gene_type:complete